MSGIIALRARLRAATLMLAPLALLLGPARAAAAPPEEPVASILCRAFSAEGFSYAWGGECWQANGCAPDTSGGVGVCDGCGDGDGCNECGPSSGCCVNGASCTHSGTWGADCSGFVSKAWQVPDPYPVSACGVARYTANAFTQDHAYWSTLPVANLLPGDAAATSSHVVLVVGPKDPYGDYDVMEAQGCTPGIVRHMRSIATSFTGARRVGLTECVCADGETETRSCGDCGEQTRTCVNDCLWSDWSPCEGPDPTGPDAACAGEGLGACAEGRRRCVAGWLTCESGRPSTDVCDGRDNDCDGVVDNGPPEALGEGLACVNTCGPGTSACVAGRVVCVSSGSGFPDEVCDGRDNDCDGLVDEDTPAVMGATAPPVGAAVESLQAPEAVVPDTLVDITVRVRNRGNEAWAAGQVRLVPVGDAAALRPEGAWTSDREVLRIEGPVASGDATDLSFRLRIPADATGVVQATFRLETDAGPIPCPAPTVDLSLPVGGAHRSGCGCQGGPGGTPGAPLLSVLLALGLGVVRTRRRARRQARDRGPEP